MYSEELALARKRKAQDLLPRFKNVLSNLIMSRTQVADDLGVALITVTRFMQGKVPSSSILMKIEDFTVHHEKRLFR